MGMVQSLTHFKMEVVLIWEIVFLSPFLNIQKWGHRFKMGIPIFDFKMGTPHLKTGKEVKWGLTYPPASNPRRFI